jgi:hypothetical protein
MTSSSSPPRTTTSSSSVILIRSKNHSLPRLQLSPQLRRFLLPSFCKFLRLSTPSQKRRDIDLRLRSQHNPHYSLWCSVGIADPFLASIDCCFVRRLLWTCATFLWRVDGVAESVSMSLMRLSYTWILCSRPRSSTICSDCVPERPNRCLNRRLGC